MSQKFLALALIAATTFGQTAFAATDAETAPRQPLTRMQRPGAPTKPIAYGSVYTDGTIQSGTGNFSATWNPSGQWYQIKITGVNYYYLSFSTAVTTSVPQGNGWCQTDSVNGNLLVRCYTLAGAPTQATFSFTTF